MPPEDHIELHRKGVAVAREDLMNDFRIFEMLDILSTQFPCTGLGDREMEWVPDRNGKPTMIAITRAGEWEMKIDPYPFTGDRFECPLPGRRIPKQIFCNNEEYHAAYYAAHLTTLPYRLVR
jgi:hypothetical protein